MKFTPEEKPTDWKPKQGEVPPCTVPKHGSSLTSGANPKSTSPVEFVGKVPWGADGQGGAKLSIETPPYKMPRSHNS